MIFDDSSPLITGRELRFRKEDRPYIKFYGESPLYDVYAEYNCGEATFSNICELVETQRKAYEYQHGRYKQNADGDREWVPGECNVCLVIRNGWAWPLHISWDYFIRTCVHPR